MSLKASFGELVGMVSFKEAEARKAKEKEEKEKRIREEMEAEIKDHNIVRGVCEECQYWIGHSPFCTLHYFE